jgi:hypothetical protein
VVQIDNEATLVSSNSVKWHLQILFISIDTLAVDAKVINLMLLYEFYSCGTSGIDEKFNGMYRKAGQDQLIPVPRGMEFPVLMGG